MFGFLNVHTHTFNVLDYKGKLSKQNQEFDISSCLAIG